MKVLAKSVLFLVCVLLAMCVFQAQATPITFVFSESGANGALDSTSFSDANLVVTIHADTSDITARSGDVFASATSLTGIFSLSGIGSGSFDAPLYVFNNQANEAVGFGDAAHYDLLDIFAPGQGLAAYDMTSAFGPVVNNPSRLIQFSDLGTSLGNLSLTGARDGTFQAFAPSASVPEPGNLLMFALGLLGMAFIARRTAIRG